MAHLLVVVGWLLTPGWAWAGRRCAVRALVFRQSIQELRASDRRTHRRDLLARTRHTSTDPRQSRSPPRLLRCGLGAARVSAPLEVRPLRARRSFGGCLH